MNINSFNRRLDKIEASLPRQDTFEFAFDYALFTPVEQAELQVFLNAFSQPLKTNEMTGEQLSQLGCWVRLEKALREGNLEEAEKLRRRMGVTLEHLVDMFLNLDISALPQDLNAPGLKVVEKGITFSLSRTYYRHLCWCAKKRPQAYRDDMWMWIETLTSEV
jgi:hypothetical protein